jgi:hypothetical protein
MGRRCNLSCKGGAVMATAPPFQFKPMCPPLADETIFWGASRVPAF